MEKKKKRFFSLVMISILFVFILFCTVFSDLSQIIDNKKNTKTLQNEYNSLLEEEEALKKEVIKLQDSEYIARYAREKYMYTKDGEIVLKIIEDEAEKQGGKNDKEQG